MKPDIVNDYNINMRLVATSDMQITEVDFLRKTKKWTRKVVFHLTDIYILNAYNMYMAKTRGRSSLPDFNVAVLTQLLSRFGEPRSIQSRPRRESRETHDMSLA